MTPVLSRAEARALDRLATESGGIPSATLMENAGRGATAALVEELPAAQRFAIVCGAGNNAGDGFVVARLLVQRGRSVRVLSSTEPSKLTGDARANFEALAALGVALEPVTAGSLGAFDAALAASDAIVDAIFGTGLTREVTGLERELVERMNRATAPKVALDLPSGLDADRGVPLGIAVRAELTLTFAGKKRGLCTPLGAEHAGRVRVVDIGIPPALAERAGYGAAELEAADVAPVIQPRTRLSHKVSSGRVLVVAGSPGKLGAALLVAHGALRAGAGLVTLAAVPSVATLLEARVLEAMTARIDPAQPEAALGPLVAQADAVVVGPGLGFDEVARRLVTELVFATKARVVVDADAITQLQGRAGELAAAKGALLLTPHPGEMGRLLGLSTKEVEADRFGALGRAVELTRATVLLKGSPTLVGAPGKPIVVVPAGHPLLATGGSGDVLSGVIAALLAASAPYAAAFAGAFLHGRAAEQLARVRGVDRGVLAHEIADAVPELILGLSSKGRFVSR